MPIRPGLLGRNKTSTANVLVTSGAGAGGMWSLNEQLAFRAQGLWTRNTPTYTITANVATINETNNRSILYTLTTTEIDIGTVLYWTNSGTTVAADFVENVASGSFTMNSNTATLALTTTQDFSTEGPETIIIDVRTGSVSGPIVATASTVTIQDTAVQADFTLTTSTGNVINEGTAITFTTETYGAADGTVLYFTITGVTEADFVSNATYSNALSGSFTVTSNFGSVTKFVAEDAVTEGTEVINFAVRTGSTSGTIVANTSVTVLDSSFSAPVGEAQFTSAGTYSWTAPTGVSQVSVVCIGGGASGSENGGVGGGGGGLGYINNYTVIPGNSYTVVVGGTSGSSYFVSTATVRGGGASGSTGGTYTGTGGGNGGAGGGAVFTYSGGGGGGAGGYSGNGGAGGGVSGSWPNLAGNNGSNGAGGGGGGGASGSLASGSYYGGGGIGGGTGLLGEGSSGTGGVLGGGGVSGTRAHGGNGTSGSGGNYGGGGRGGDGAGFPLSGGSSGAVRIIWGSGRSFPTTNVGELRGVNILVVAGGGGGGGGGGGAGGMIANAYMITKSVTYTVTVGAGGAATIFGGPYVTPTAATNGINSSITAASGFANLIALGGGAGGYYTSFMGQTSGAAGGSGGGAGAGGGGQDQYGGGATQPSSPSGGFGNAGGRNWAQDGNSQAGGGGGAGGTGSNGSPGQSGPGGIGRIWIDGKYYAGGGGGGGAPGGLGGGGTGSAGTVNTGGGSGGHNTGGSGIVIISYSGNVAATGGNIVTFSGRTTHTFTTSGTFTFTV